jgi:hypothetical protein
MLASLTFTYGDKRSELYNFKNKDSGDRYFRNKLDYNLFVFHNSPDSFIEKTKSTFFSNFNLTYAKITGSYPSALKKALLLLKEKGVTKVVFLQDDVFCLQKEKKTIDNLIELLRITELPHLNLEYCYNNFADKLQNVSPTLNVNGLKIFKTDTNFFKTATPTSWSFDDSAYYSSLNFMLDHIYDSKYFTYPDIWSAEWYLKAKFNQINMPRPITDIKFFRRVNLLGPNNNREAELNFLNKEFSI